MNRTLTLASLALTSAAFLAFTGCGGGSDSAPVAAVVPVTAVVVPDVPVASAAVTFTGTVATGAAFVGAIMARRGDRDNRCPGPAMHRMC